MFDHVGMEKLTENLKSYVNTHLEILKLELTDRTAVIGAGLVSSILVGLVWTLFVVFLSLGVGFYLSFLLGNFYSGFAFVAGFYLCLAVVLMIGRKKLIEKPLRNSIIRQILTKKED